MSNASPIKSVPLSRTAFVVAEVRRAILAGELQPGQPLVEAELAATFSMSKTPVREALKTLVGIGLVTMSEYKGAVVRVVDANMAKDVFEVRALLEPAAVERAVHVGVDTAAARRALERAESADNPGDRSMANREFHRLMYAACGNPLLIEMLEQLRDQTALITVVAWRDSISWKHEAAEHEAILSAVEHGHAEQARDLEKAHITAFADHAMTRLEEK